MKKSLLIYSSQNKWHLKKTLAETFVHTPTPCMLHEYSCVLTAISIRIGLLSSKIHNGDATPKSHCQYFRL